VPVAPRLNHSNAVAVGQFDTRKLEPSAVPRWRVIRLFIGNADIAPAVCFWDLQPGRLGSRHDIHHALRAHRTLNTAAAAHIVTTLHSVALPRGALAGVLDDLHRTSVLIGDSLKHHND